jgi:hypothetical protein
MNDHNVVVVQNKIDDLQQFTRACPPDGYLFVGFTHQSIVVDHVCEDSEDAFSENPCFNAAG